MALSLTLSFVSAPLLCFSEWVGPDACYSETTGTECPYLCLFSVFLLLLCLFCWLVFRQFPPFFSLLRLPCQHALQALHCRFVLPGLALPSLRPSRFRSADGPVFRLATGSGFWPGFRPLFRSALQSPPWAGFCVRSLLRPPCTGQLPSWLFSR